MGNQTVKCCFLQMEDCLMPTPLMESYIWSLHFAYVASLQLSSLACCALKKSEDPLWERDLIGKNLHFDVFQDAKQDFFSFLKLFSSVEKQFAQKKSVEKTPFMLSSHTFLRQRIATYISWTPDLTLPEKCSFTTGFACWWNAVLWSFWPHCRTHH